ncbi:signal peptidase II [Actinophytocola sp.]|uniref:signal peptidase II n=1 Tax=Actinophytocola sp. TaxID=1872138 RepID=UPI00389A4D83
MDTTPVRRLPLALVIAVVVVLLDQGTKLWAERTLTNHAPIPVLGDLLRFRLLYNSGAAFSMGEHATWIFTIITAVAAGWLLWAVTRPQPTARLVGFALLLGGATTHLGDRLFRAPGFAQGHVVDFIDYNGWFVGNVADIVLFCGAVWTVLFGLRAPETSTSH